MSFFTPGKTRTNILFALGILLALFQLFGPIYLTGLLDIQFRAVHVAFGLTIAFLNYPLGRRRTDDAPTSRIAIADICIIVLLLAANVNAFLKAMDIYTGLTGAGTFDLAIGVALILVVLEAARRTVGIAIPIMA